MPTLEWSTSEDWSNIQSKSKVYYGLSGTSPDLTLGVSEGWEDGDYTASPRHTAGLGSLSNWSVLSGKQQELGSVGYVLEGISHNLSTPQVLVLDDSFHNGDFVFELGLKRTGSEYADGGFVFCFEDQNNWQFIRSGSGGTNAKHDSINSGNVTTIQDGTEVSNSVENQWAIWKLERSGDTYTLSTKSPGGSYTQEFSNQNTSQGEGKIGVVVNAGGSGSNSYEMFFNTYNYTPSNGSFTTGVKSFQTAAKPDLESMEYTSGGGSITLRVIGSPGSTSEEVVEKELDGNGSYTLEWSSSHTDFKLEADMSTTDLSSPPNFGQARLNYEPIPEAPSNLREVSP